MDLSKTIIPKSDQINFDDVRSQPITAVIKSVREGSKDQPVFIDLIGYDGRPYKPSKSMRRVLIGGWGNNGHSWAGKSLTLIGDPSVKYGGVAVGGIKINAMSDIDGELSMMLTESRGKRVEHRVKKLDVKSPEKPSDDRSPDRILCDFTEAAGSAKSIDELEKFYKYSAKKLADNAELLDKATYIYQIRKDEIAPVE